MLLQSWYPDAQLTVSETLSHLHWLISVTMGATIVQLYTLDFFNVSFNIYFLNITVDSLVTEWGWMWLCGGSVTSPRKQTAIISDTMLWNLQLPVFMFSYLSCPIVLIASPLHYLKLHICKESQSLCNHLSVSCKESTRSNYWFFFKFNVSFSVCLVSVYALL